MQQVTDVAWRGRFGAMLRPSQVRPIRRSVYYWVASEQSLSSDDQLRPQNCDCPAERLLSRLLLNGVTTMPLQHPNLTRACAELIRRWHERYGVADPPSNMNEGQ